MSGDCITRRWEPSKVLWGIASFMLCLPTGALVGILVGLVDQFGLRFTLDNIRANPQMFANQFAPYILYSGWFAVASLPVLMVIVAID